MCIFQRIYMPTFCCFSSEKIPHATVLHGVRSASEAGNEAELNAIDGEMALGMYAYFLPVICVVYVDGGDKTYLNHCVVDATLNLKIGAEVFLKVNLSRQLINGTPGTVVGFQDPKASTLFINAQAENAKCWPVIDFGGRREVIKARTFEICMDRVVIATRVQIPLMLSYV